MRSIRAAGLSVCLLSALSPALSQHQLSDPDAPSLFPEVDALVEIGAVGTARRLARRSVEVSPADAQAQYSLAHALSHDLIGRHLMEGFDRKGAIEALRTATRLNPPGYRFYARRLVDLLVRNDRGVRLGEGANIHQAIDLLKELRSRNTANNAESGGMLDELCEALLAVGRHEEILDLVEPSATVNPAIWLAAAQAMVEGPDAAVESAFAHQPESSAAIVATEAAVRLRQVREYQSSVQLVEALIRRTSVLPQHVKLRAEAQAEPWVRHEQMPDHGDPYSVVRRWLVAAVKGDHWRSSLTPLISSCGMSELRDPTRQRAFLSWRARLRNPILTGWSQLDRELDRLFNTYEASVAGDEQLGYYVRVTPERSQPMHFFLIREDGDLKILDFSQGFLPDVPDVACEVFRRLERGDPPGARQLLDWAREVGARSPIWNFPSVWREDVLQDEGRIRLAAALLQIRDASRAGEAARVIEEEMGVVALPSVRYAVLRDLSTAYEIAGDWERAFEVNERRLQGPLRLDARGRKWFLLGKMGRREELKQAIDEVLAGDRPNVRELTPLGMAARELSERRSLERIAAEHDLYNKPRSANYYRIAWAAVATDTVDSKALAAADRAVETASPYGTLERSTRAAVLALAGKPRLARTQLLESVRLSRRPPDERHWFVHGLILEALGLTGEAKAAYHRSSAAALGRLERTAAPILARRRLAALEGVEPGPL